jgi:2-polyprenyl-3-methyl-5-hydroxy-6-metoxy-1,4-benzoquinol methylase
MPDLTRRSEEIEVMDDLNCSGVEVDQTLRELEFINIWLGGNDVTLGAIKKIFQDRPKEIVYTIGDVGCGGGDMLHLIHKWAHHKNFRLKLIGIDANPNIISYAIKHSARFPGMQFESMNIFSDQFKELKFDVIIGTLFFHHFRDDQLISFFKSLKNQVKVALVINDIHRHFLAYHSIKILTQLFSKSPMVKNDAPLSVHRAFRKEELQRILAEAGYDKFSIKWCWAFRWRVIVYMQ